MNKQNGLQDFFSSILGLSQPWTVTGVIQNSNGKSVDITVEWSGNQAVPCPDCGKSCKMHDHSKERVWRHLDTMEFETLIKCSVPRSDCVVHGVKVIKIPWAGPNSHFTLKFESYAIDVLLGAASTIAATKLLKITWDQIHLIKQKAVSRGLERRDLSTIKSVGIDEKSFRNGQNYISTMADHAGHRILDVVEDRTKAATDLLIQTLPLNIRNQIKAVTLDMWPAFITSARNNFPNADLIHDRFHIEKYLGEAVSKVRFAENKDLVKKGDNTLVGTKFVLLRNIENMKEEDLKKFKELKNTNLKAARAWGIKNLFSNFWDYTYQGSAESFFKSWYSWASRSQLPPIVKVAKMIKSHFPNILTYLKHHLTNGIVEGFNSKIQSIKASARGFRNFQNYRIAILFQCGKLELHP
jgi:transposase